jgi:hypothetical protein
MHKQMKDAFAVHHYSDGGSVANFGRYDQSIEHQG